LNGRREVKNSLFRKKQTSHLLGKCKQILGYITPIISRLVQCEVSRAGFKSLGVNLKSVYFFRLYQHHFVIIVDANEIIVMTFS